VRTNIIVNDQLMKEALRLSGLLTKKQKKLAAWFGKLSWNGNLDSMRTDR